MSIQIITQFRTKDGCSKDLIALISRVLPESLDHDGCVEICIRQNQDEPNDIISVQQWASRHHYESYRAWRKQHGVTAAIEEFLAEPISVRYFDDVPMQNDPTPKSNDVSPIKLAEPFNEKPPEIPKVGSTDALGG
jgi:quinol monooxygenase YgiN